MNYFERVVEDNKLYLKVTTKDEEGNMSINCKICSDDKEFDLIKNKLVTGIEKRVSDIKEEMTKLSKMSESLQSELDVLKKI